MGFRKGDIVELTIDKMAYGGHGIGRANGLVVFVRGAVPGDWITARIHRKKKGYAEANIVELLTASADRIEAPCPYSRYCGGCQLQQVRYERQLSYKREYINESMTRIGGLKRILIHEVIPCESTFAYRNKMEFSFSDRRWFLPHEMDKREKEGGFALGLHVPGTYHKVIDIEACLLQHEKGNLILQEVRKYVRASGTPVYGLKSHEGFWRFLTIRYSRAFDQWMVNLITSDQRPEVVQPLADILCDRIAHIKTIVNNINTRKASIALGEREIVLSGDGLIKDKIGANTFQISANSFFQTNSLASQRLYQKVVDYAEAKGNETVLDLYSGTGTIPIYLASRVRDVTGIEISESSVIDAQRNCELNGVHNCKFLCGDIREKLSSIAHRPDILIIDPPRAGIHKDVLAQVLAFSPEKIIYISCNPATMARDIAGLIQDYELIEIQPVDMFPHTFHIEAVGKLWRRKKA